MKPEHLKVYAGIGRLMVRYGRSDLVRSAGIESAVEAEAPGDAAPSGDGAAPDRLAHDLEEMGPTFVKLGQLLSTRADLIPPAYMEGLTRLQDQVDPVDSSRIEELVEEELGVRISKAFRRFDSEPLASASLGQVHYAELRTGRPVAVKVQRPDIRRKVTRDLEALESLADLLADRTALGEQYDLPGMAQEFRASIYKELDYREEAANLRRLGDDLERFDRLVVPAPIDDYTTSRVLTMEFVEGRKITKLSPLAHIELDGAELTDQLFEAYLHQVLVEGFFHADPHPGNLFITPDHRIALLDLGMVGKVAPRLQGQLIRLLLAIAERKGEEAADVAVRLGEVAPGFDEKGFEGAIAELVASQAQGRVEDIEVGRVVMGVTRIAAEYGIQVPANLTLLGKTLLNLDRVGRVLDPKFDPNEAVRRHSTGIMRRQITRGASAGNVFSSVLEANEFVQQFPKRLNRVLGRMARNELQFKIDAFDEVLLMEGLQKVANRIAMGLVLAALIVGAAMLMQVETDFTILGYPGFAMILFLAAVGGGIALFVEILTHDEKRDRRAKRRRG